jgi:hypothetical protein
MSMKTLSVLFTIALLFAANQLAARMKQTGALPKRTQATSQIHQTSDLKHK